MSNMLLESKERSSLLLVITSFVLSRALFFFFHDPEGPNLLIVTALALILYSASVIVWKFIPATSVSKKLLFAICTQLLIVSGLYTIA
jgi:predicted neutral ceramidase superfamily lipid hydrolase